MAQRLDVWIESFPEPLGTLASDDNGSVSFGYSDAYLSDPNSFPISLSLALQAEPFSDPLTRAFFGNLLPENDQLRRLLEREGLDAADIVGILFHLGADLSGALSCLPEGNDPVKVPGLLASDYIPISRDELIDIVQRLGNNGVLPDELRDPSPVAGLQRKIALVKAEDGFAVPIPGGGAPTTHILKVPAPGLPREAYYEGWCSKLALENGVETALSRSEWFDQFEVVISERFDRRTVDGRVYRIHQEDFAQALGLPPRLKYERDGRPGRIYNAEAIRAVLDRTAVPAEAIFNFLRATFFNLAVGNSDNHAKNHALLYDRGAVPRLAPLYDVVPIRLSREHHHKFSFRIGAADDLASLSSTDLLTFLGTFGIEGNRAARFLERDVLALIGRLNQLPAPKSDWDRPFFRQIADDSDFIVKVVEEAIGRSRRGSRPVRAAAS